VAQGRIDVVLVCGGRWHDFDFARIELLRLLNEHERIRVRVFEDYDDVDALRGARLLVSYTCDVVPADPVQRELCAWLEGGGRWFALHGTNSVIRFLSRKPLRIGTPRAAPLFMEMLGSQFLAHPPIGPFRVEIADPEHELTRGLAAFETSDEQYLQEYHGTPHALLHTRFDGATPEFERTDWRADPRHLVWYLNRRGAGAVMYLTLGHCRGRYDMAPLMAEYPRVERCSWELPVYYELLRRGIRWGAGL
jgi:hypothetical protein